MSLDEYLGEYKEKITENEYNTLKQLYDNVVMWEKTAEVCFNKLGKSDIDYSNDYNKAMLNVQRYESIFNNALDEIKQKYTSDTINKMNI